MASGGARSVSRTAGLGRATPGPTSSLAGQRTLPRWLDFNLSRPGNQGKLAYLLLLPAVLLVLGTRLLPGWLLHRLIRLAMRLPRRGSLRG